MGTELANTERTQTGRGIVFQEPPLTSSLKAVIERSKGEALAFLPVVSREEDAALEAAMTAIEDSLAPASPEAIAAMLGAIALLHPEGKWTDKEQRARVKLYQGALGDLPHDALQHAFHRASQEIAFLPKPAELRKYAASFLGERRVRLQVMRSLRLKHRLEWVEPKSPPEPPTPEYRDEFNRNMRRARLKTRLRENGEMYMLTPEDEDPAPADEPSEAAEGSQ